MKRKYTLFLLALFIVLAFFSRSPAAVEWEIQKTLKLEAPPLDVAVSANGKWVFVLTSHGSILIYSSDGVLREKIGVGNHVDEIETGFPDLIERKICQGKCMQCAGG